MQKKRDPKAGEKKRMAERAKAIKEEGNGHYKAGRLEEALTCYRKASALQPDDPVYHSNISAVLYEVGRYQESINSIMHALALLTGDSSNPALESRLLLRKAKAQFYMHKFTEGSQTLTELEDLCAKKGVANPDTDGATKNALHRASANLVPQDHPMPFHIFHSPVETSVKEFSITMHETPTSAFSGYFPPSQLKAVEDCPSVDPQDRYQHRLKFYETAPGRIRLNPPTYHQFSFLYGGVGDGRNVMASLHEIGSSFKSQTRAVTRFHFTLVDVKAAAMARTLVLFYLLKHLATIPPKRQSHDLNAIELIAVMQYMLLSTTMPSYLAVRLEVVMKELRRDIQENSLPKWIVIHPESVPEIIKCLDFWIDFKVTVKEMYNRTADIHRKSAKKKENEETPRQKTDKMTEEELNKFIIQGLTTNQQKRDTIRLALEFQLYADDEELFLMGTQTETTLYAHTKFLSPPHVLLKRHPHFETFYRLNKAILDRVMVPEDLTFSFKALIDDALETWKPNPTIWDQDFMDLAGKNYKFDHHAFYEGHFLFYPLAHPHKPCSLYDYAFDFFSRVSAGIAKLANGSYQFTLECVVAELFSFAFDISHAKKARSSSGLPYEFDRIYLSSIPDSAGGNLSVSAILMPMLKTLPHAELSYVIAPTNPDCETLQDWLQSFTLLTQNEHEIYLGMRYLNGNLWGENIRWQPIIPASSNLATQDDFTLWLYRVFLFIVLPKSVEDEPSTSYPLNLVLFIHVCTAFLVFICASFFQFPFPLLLFVSSFSISFILFTICKFKKKKKNLKIYFSFLPSRLFPFNFILFIYKT
eukprot:Phypoly_transcript_01864.p1 GENE.Phypoly_transcript_01864~~Phypoly_transcript_01864.p1  ORF type:complete len:813 (+),score=122.50 Phypoly_transcript_01864:95-2533(+)